MNNEIFFKLHSLAHQSIFLDWLIVFCAVTLSYIVIALVAIFLLLHKDGKFNYRIPFEQIINKTKEIATVFSISVLSWFIASLLKGFILAPRPFMVFENFRPLFVHGGMDSFPSGHAMFFGALATSVFFYHKRLGAFLFVLAIIISLARVVSGIHYPIDIFFGLLFGVVVALMFRFIIRRIK